MTESNNIDFAYESAVWIGLVGTLCFCPTGQPLGWLKSWGPESSVISIHLHFRCLGLEPQTAGAPRLAIFLWPSHGISPAWSTQGSCTPSLYLRATRSVGKRRKEKGEKERKHSRGKLCSSLLLSLSSHAACCTLCLLSRPVKADPGLRVGEMGFTSAWVNGKGLERQV